MLIVLCNGFLEFCIYIFGPFKQIQASDFSDVGDWPTLGEAASLPVVRPKEEGGTGAATLVAASGTGLKSRAWAEEVGHFKDRSLVHGNSSVI